MGVVDDKYGIPINGLEKKVVLRGIQWILKCLTRKEI